ncbi:MAG: hypothetical protein L0191_12430, partial [Acidobacteria bacterium]|nr:hypothetical protein [Acidobacteriota bacterium]
MKDFVLAFGCLVMLMACGENEMAKAKLAEADLRYKAEDDAARNGTLILPHGVSGPIYRFLLVRKDRDACALRFTDIHRGGDARPRSWWQEGGESEYAEYDWYYQGDGSGDFTRPNVQSGHGNLYEKPAVGIGRLRFSRGINAIRCGSFRLGWSYPSYIYMIT